MIKYSKKETNMKANKTKNQSAVESSSDSENEETMAKNDLENRLSDDSDHRMTDDDEDDTLDADASGSGSDDEDDNAAGTGDIGWAKAMAKILKQEKPKNKKSLILSKAKKTPEILAEKAKKIGFEIEGEEIKEEKPDKIALKIELEAKAAERATRKKNILSLRIKPSFMDLERERTLKKIGTKGVVQLFNAVRMQQKDLSVKLDAVGRMDHKRDAVLNNINKRKFLDVLMGGSRAKSEMVDNPIKDEEMKEEHDDDDDVEYDDAVYNDGLPKNSIWSVLKEDFMTNKKLTHWDKEDDADVNQQNTDDEEVESADDDSD